MNNIRATKTRAYIIAAPETVFRGISASAAPRRRPTGSGDGFVPAKSPARPLTLGEEGRLAPG